MLQLVLGPVIPYSVPIIILLILAASAVIFALHLRRWTKDRKWLVLSEWAASHGYRIERNEKAEAPDVLSELTKAKPKILISLVEKEKKETILVQAEVLSGDLNRMAERWNLLIRKVQASWPVMILRPTANQTSAFDLLLRDGMNAVAMGNRFFLHGEQKLVMRGIAGSSIAALLPANIGMALVGENLILDFSARPFDTIEIQRLYAVAEQLLAHLPVINWPRVQNETIAHPSK